jgi:hypothetical protein
MHVLKFHAMALGFLAVLNSAMIARAQPVPTPQRPTISVLGEALVHVQPDRVLVTLGVETFDADVQVKPAFLPQMSKRTTCRWSLATRTSTTTTLPNSLATRHVIPLW